MLCMLITYFLWFLFLMLLPRGSSTRWSYTCYFCFDFNCPGALQPGGLMTDASRLFNPMVLHLLLLFRLLMPRGSSTRWSYTCYFYFVCPEALQPGGLMYIWCLGGLQPDGLTRDLPIYLSTLVLRSTSTISFHFMLILIYYAIKLIYTEDEHHGSFFAFFFF